MSTHEGLAPPLNAARHGLTLEELAKRGVRFAVRHGLSGCHMVPAGIVAVNRAQERGYSLATVI